VLLEKFDPYPGWRIDDQDMPTALVSLPQAFPKRIRRRRLEKHICFVFHRGQSVGHEVSEIF